MSLTASPTHVAGYGLDAPTHDSAVAALAKHLGPAEAERVWAAACTAVGVQRFRRADAETLQRVATHLAKERSVIGVCASSINVRLISYTMLLRKQQAQQQLAGAPVGR